MRAASKSWQTAAPLSVRSDPLTDERTKATSLRWENGYRYSVAPPTETVSLGSSAIARVTIETAWPRLLSPRTCSRKIRSAPLRAFAAVTSESKRTSIASVFPSWFAHGSCLLIRTWFLCFEDHLTEPYILAVQDFIPDGPKTAGDLLSSEMRDMFMRIRVEQYFSIDPLQYPPEPAAVVRRANHQDSARLKDPPHFRPDVRTVRDKFDHFGVDHCGKA